jgi:hypothetical protein
MRRIRSRCCALAAVGQTDDAAAPPSSVMNWRRLRSSMGSPSEPAVPAYSSPRMPRKRPQVLGVDLNRSESTPWDSGVQSVLVKERFQPADLVERIRRLVHSNPPVSNEMEAAS